MANKEQILCRFKKPQIVTLDEHDNNFKSGCAIIEVNFPSKKPFELETIQFTNSYTAYLSIKAQCKNKTNEPGTSSNGERSWITIIKCKQLMPNVHCDISGQDTVTITREEMLAKPDNMLSMRFILRQSSPVWTQFSIENIKLLPKASQEAVIVMRNRELPASTVNPTVIPDAEMIAKSLQNLWALTYSIRVNTSHPLLRKYEYENVTEVETRVFAVDPSITSYSSLKFLLMGAFKLQGNFSVTYLSRNATTTPDNQIYLNLNSDWDLEGAFMNASVPILQLKVTKIVNDDDKDKEWQKTHNRHSMPSVNNKIVTKGLAKHLVVPFKHAFKNQISRRLSKVTSAFNDSVRRTPVTISEWQTYLDDEGQLTRSRAEDLRMRVFNGGVDLSARPTIWPHLLNVYPVEMTADDRSTYMVVKAREYARMKLRWQGLPPERTAEITNMIMKDVLRTDRSYPYFAVDDNHPNLFKLFNILATYAFTYPEVSYCQGMSDLAAPLLVTMNDEAVTFWCFNALMSRMKLNFLSDGSAMMTKFEHLSQLLERWDPEFNLYLKNCGAGDMFFCYRWILLDLKREFCFNDALRLYEIIWATLPQNPQVGLARSVSTPALYGSVSISNLESRSESFDSEVNEVSTIYSQYGYGGPFVLFLCLTILLQHRDHIMRNHMDHNTLAMYFDRLVRKHDLNKVIMKARLLFSDFLRTEIAPETEQDPALMQDSKDGDASISC